jgi:hypothetical protein
VNDAFDYMTLLPTTMQIDHIQRQYRLKRKRLRALQWMWLNNIKERTHVVLRRP